MNCKKKDINWLKGSQENIVTENIIFGTHEFRK